MWIDNVLILSYTSYVPLILPKIFFVKIKGVPLDECPTSASIEQDGFPNLVQSCSSDMDSVPLLVKVCTSIVEQKGLEIVGIYRIPGNNAAVTYLTELVNKGLDHVEVCLINGTKLYYSSGLKKPVIKPLISYTQLTVSLFTGMVQT